jgi:hypothetical protein
MQVRHAKGRPVPDGARSTKLHRQRATTLGPDTTSGPCGYCDLFLKVRNRGRWGLWRRAWAGTRRGDHRGPGRLQSAPGWTARNRRTVSTSRHPTLCSMRRSLVGRMPRPTDSRVGLGKCRSRPRMPVLTSRSSHHTSVSQDVRSCRDPPPPCRRAGVPLQRWVIMISAVTGRSVTRPPMEPQFFYTLLRGKRKADSAVGRRGRSSTRARLLETVVVAREHGLCRDGYGNNGNRA